MALRDKISKNVQPYLLPDEKLQAVFSAETASRWLMVLGLIPFLAVNRYRTVAVTDRRILVFNSGVLSATKAKSVVTEMNRAGTLGPGSGLWHRIQAGHETLRVHRRFFKDLAAADAFLTTPGPPA